LYRNIHLGDIHDELKERLVLVELPLQILLDEIRGTQRGA